MSKEHTDILILGGGPAALVSASTALEHFTGKKITLVKEDKYALVPCGIPYIFGKTLGSSQKDIMPCGAMEQKINIVVDTAMSVDIETKTLYAKEHTITFEKLVFATGSVPFVHKSFEDALHLKNVFTIEKHKEKIDALVAAIDTKEKIIIIGTGFIGVEMATELCSAGKDVAIIGGKHILADAFDLDMAVAAESIMKEMGIRLVLGQHASRIIPAGDIAQGAELCDGSIIEGELIILATGYRPNTKIAKEAGLKLARYEGIWVDEYMRTKNKDIFAVGDCCGRRDFITRAPSKVMLASTSASEARVAGSSLYGLKQLKGFNGTIAIFSTIIGGRTFASAGVSEQRAKEENIDCVVGFYEGLNRHPAAIPDASKQSVKLIALKSSGQIIGGQVVGDKEAGEVINIIGLAIETELTAYKILSLQVATQPLLTAAPTAYPIIKAAEQIVKVSLK